MADSPIDETHYQERMIRECKWIMSKKLPRKYGKIAPLPPLVDPMPIIGDAKTNAKPR